MLKIKLLTTIILLIASINTCFATQKLINYLGTGANPRLYLELSPQNGPGWPSVNIDYAQIGEIPWSKTYSNSWTPWNVKDEHGNYYGTITLYSSGDKATWGKYTAGPNGYYLEGVIFNIDPKTNVYFLKVKIIHSGT